MGATACLDDGTTLAATVDYPRGSTARRWLASRRATARDGRSPDLGLDGHDRGRIGAGRRGTARSRRRPGGFVVILQNFALLERLDLQTRRLVLIGLIAVLGGRGS